MRAGLTFIAAILAPWAVVVTAVDQPALLPSAIAALHMTLWEFGDGIAGWIARGECRS